MKRWIKIVSMVTALLFLLSGIGFAQFVNELLDQEPIIEQNLLMMGVDVERLDTAIREKLTEHFPAGEIDFIINAVPPTEEFVNIRFIHNPTGSEMDVRYYPDSDPTSIGVTVTFDGQPLHIPEEMTVEEFETEAYMLCCTDDDKPWWKEVWDAVKEVVKEVVVEVIKDWLLDLISG